VKPISFHAIKTIVRDPVSHVSSASFNRRGLLRITYKTDLINVTPIVGLAVGIESHLHLTSADLQVFNDHLMPFVVVIRHIDACGVIAYLGIHIQFVEGATALDVAFQSIEAVL
jgi:hypothetical protein